MVRGKVRRATKLGEGGWGGKRKTTTESGKETMKSTTVFRYVVAGGGVSQTTTCNYLGREGVEERRSNDDYLTTKFVDSPFVFNKKIGIMQSENNCD